MWRAFGIGVSSYSTIENSIPHPMNENRKLFFLADGPHLLKTLKNSLLNNKVFKIPEEIVRDNNINFSYVKCDHLKELLEIQENITFKLTHKLQSHDLKNGRFAKMKVNKEKQILSTVVSSSLKFLADNNNNKKEYITTAWFIETISKWFTLITSRSPQVALGNNETDKSSQKYNEAVNFLHAVMKLFRNIQIGTGKTRKTNRETVQINNDI